MAIDSAFSWGAGGEAIPHDELEQRRRVAMAMMAKDRGQPMGWAQGLSQGLDKVLGAMMMRDANGQADANRAYESGVMKDLLGGSTGGNVSATPGMNIPRAQAPTPTSPAWPGEETAAATPGGSARTMSWNGEAPTGDLSGGKKEFVERLLPSAIEVSQRTGIDPRIIVGQAAIETGWGRSAPGNNFFGIKSHGVPGGNTLPTTEFVNGSPVRENASFRAYASPEESVKGYGDFMTQNPRYGQMRQAQGMDAQLAALQKSGYATDPNYSAKVGNVARGVQVASLGGAVPSGGNPAAMPAADIEQQAAMSQAEPSWQEASALPNLAPPQRQAPQPSPGVAQVAQAMPQGPDQNRLMMMLADPRLSEGTKKILMLKMQQQEAERARQNEINKPTEGIRNYEYGVKNPGFNQREMELRRANATNVTTNVGGGSDKQIFDTMDESAKAARTTAAGLTGLREARNAIQGGAFTGAGANEMLGLQKIGAALGLANTDKIVNTETFRSAIAPQVAAMLKSTVGTTNISNTDREFAEKAAGGNITLDGGSINRLLDIMERASTAQLEGHQKRLEKVYPDAEKHGRERALFGVDLPAAPAMAPRAAPQAPPAIQDGATATNPKTGERLIFKNGKWQSAI